MNDEPSSTAGVSSPAVLHIEPDDGEAESQSLNIDNIALIETSDAPPISWRKTGRLYEYLSFTAYCCTYSCMGLVLGAYGPALLRISAQLGMPIDPGTGGSENIGEMGMLFTARGIGWLLGSILMGPLIDRFNSHGHWMLALSSWLCGVMFIVQPFIRSFWLFLLTSAVHGASCGSLDTVANTLVVWLFAHRPKAVPPFMQAMHLAMGAGAFVAPFVVALGFVIDGQRILFSFAAMGVFSIFCGVLPIITQSPPKPSSVIPDAHGPSVAKESEEVEMETLEENTSHPEESSIRSPSKPYVSGIVVLTAAFLFLYVGAEVGFAGWVTSYAVQSGLTTEKPAALLTSAFWGALTVTRIVSIPLSAKVSAPVMLIADMIICVAGIVLIIFIPTSLAVLWIGTIIFGIGMASVYPTGISLPPVFGVVISGKFMAVMIVGAAAGELVIPFVIAPLFERFGPISVCWAMVVVLVLALGVFGLLWITGKKASRSRKREGQD